MLDLKLAYKFSALLLAFSLHLGVAVVFAWTPAWQKTGVAEDFGFGGIEVSLSSVAEKSSLAEKPATQKQSIKPKALIEEKESAKLSKQKPTEEVFEEQEEIEERLPEAETHQGGGVQLTQKNYIATLLILLEKNKSYPYQARRRQQEGTSVLYFEIDKAGKVLQFYIKQSSGYPLLDHEAMAMIERAKPFPAMPKDMSMDKMVLTLPVQFYLR